MNRILLIAAAVCLLIMTSADAGAKTYRCTKAADVTGKLPSAVPGDTFVMANGDYKLAWLKLCRHSGATYRCHG